MRLRLALALLLVASIPQAFPQDQNRDEDEQRFRAAVKISESRSDQIKAELRYSKKQEWAGAYYFGDGLGLNIDFEFAPQSGFVITWKGCLGTYGVSYGSVTFQDKVVQLAPEASFGRMEDLFLAPQFVKVRWGKRHYLVAADHMIEFANHVNAGLEPNTLFGGLSESFLLKLGDEKRRVSGQPDLPPEFLSYLLPKPVEAKIMSVGTTEVCDKELNEMKTSVTISAGRAEGLKPGMELYLNKPSKIFGTAKITAVDEHSATAVLDYMSDEGLLPSVAWELSSKI